MLDYTRSIDCNAGRYCYALINALNRSATGASLAVVVPVPFKWNLSMGFNSTLADGILNKTKQRESKKKKKKKKKNEPYTAYRFRVHFC